MDYLLLAIKWIFWVVITVVVAFYVFSALRYRLSFSAKTVSFTGEIVFRFIDLDTSTRHLFEESIGNRKLSFESGQTVYISKADMAKLWQINPHDMLERNIKYIVTVNVKILTFGGYGKATLTAMEQVAGEPHIRK